MFYVYEWFIKDTDAVIYVGKGCGHRYKVRKHNKAFNLFIKLFDCDSRIVKKFENEKDAFDFEFTRIKELKEKGQCYCNIYEGGKGGERSWWTDELRKHYSEKNVMKSESQRARMTKHNPMKDPAVSEKANGQKRRKVTIGDTTYNSIKEAMKALGASQSNLNTWAKRGMTPDGRLCTIEPQKQHWHNMHGNQKPNRGNTDNSTPEGSTTNG